MIGKSNQANPAEGGSDLSTINSQPSTSPTTAIGIDVGAPGKGFHAAALRNNALLDQFQSPDPAAVAAWCRRHAARVIAIDAPCLWRPADRPRLAERQLAAAGISCFPTPTRADAESHPRGYYDWMLHGARLYRELAASHPLLDETDPAKWGEGSGPVCFETYPHAITTALLGEKARAKNKRRDRRALLEKAGIATAELPTIDHLDAALCALTARHFATARPITAYGDAATGWIIIPQRI